MMAFWNVYPDPGISHGSFRVLPYAGAAGAFIVVDTRRKPGHQRVGEPFWYLEEAALAARTWNEQGYG